MNAFRQWFMPYQSLSQSSPLVRIRRSSRLPLVIGPAIHRGADDYAIHADSGQLRGSLISHIRSAIFCLLLAGLLASLAACSHLGFRRAGAPEAEAAARRMISAMGGRRALEKIHYLHFEFVIRGEDRSITRRTHIWDRAKGRYRLEGKENGQPYVALFNVNTRQGQAFEGLKLQPAANPQVLINAAYAHFVEDTAWLLAPFRAFDAGAYVDYSVQPSSNGHSYPTLALWFDRQARDAPPNVYWFYLDESSGRPYSWAYAPADQSAPPLTFLWTKWQFLGKLLLPVRFEQAGGSRVVTIENLYTPANIPNEVFESIAAPLNEKFDLRM